MHPLSDGRDEPRRKASRLRREFILSSILFGLLFVTVLGLGTWILIKDLGEREIFRVLNNYSKELEEQLRQIPSTKTLKGFQRRKVITTRLNAFMLDKRLFDSYELYDEGGNLVDSKDVPVRGEIVYGTAPEGGLQPGQREIVMSPKIPIQVPVPIEPGKMGRAILSVSQEVLERQAMEFRRGMMTKVLVMVGVIVLLLALAYLYTLRVLRLSKRIEFEGQRQEHLSYLGLLSSGLAHEIKNPLNSIQMNLQLLEEELAPGAEPCEDPSLWIQPIRKEIRRLETLVNDFLLYARPIQPERTPMDVGEFLEEIRDFLAPQAGEKGVDLLVEAEEGLPELHADENLLRNALINLVLNAIQAVEEGGFVALRAGRRGPSVRIEVWDSGEGIPEENREEVFKIFVTSKTGGTGLGLPIARRIAESHGGSLHSETGAGGPFGARHRMVLEIPPAAGEE